MSMIQPGATFPNGSEKPNSSGAGKKKRRISAPFVFIVALCVLFVCTAIFCFVQRGRKQLTAADYAAEAATKAHAEFMDAKEDGQLPTT